RRATVRGCGGPGRSPRRGGRVQSAARADALPPAHRTTRVLRGRADAGQAGRMTASPISVDAPDRDGVAVLTLQRPDKRNALSIGLGDAMSDALDQLATDERCRVVVVTGAGEAFSAGFDLDEFARPQVADELWASSDRWHRTLLEFPLPLVAAVNGP